MTLLCLTATSGSAQWKFGIKGGGNVFWHSNVIYKSTSSAGSNSEVLNDISGWGVQLGGYTNYSFSQYWGAQAEVLFAIHSKFYGEKMLSIPLLADFKPFQYVPFSLMAGPQISFLELPGPAHIASNSHLAPEFALSLSAQYTFIERLSLNLRYNHSFTNKVNNEYTSAGISYSEKGGKSRIVELSLGWTLNRRLPPKRYRPCGC